MYTTVTKSDFIQAFHAIRPDNFSYEGLCALFDYLEEYEEGTGEQMELDVIALCCDFSEATLEEIAEDYGIGGTDEEILEQVDEHLVYETDSGTWIYRPW